MTEEDTFRRLKRVPLDKAQEILSDELYRLPATALPGSKERALEIFNFISKRAPDFGWTANDLVKIISFESREYCSWKKPLKN